MGQFGGTALPGAPWNAGAARYGDGVIVIGKKKRSITEKRQLPRPEQVRFPLAVLIRMFLIGSVAVIGSAWAIWRHYNVPHPPMVVPVVRPAPSEIEVEPPP